MPPVVLTCGRAALGCANWQTHRHSRGRLCYTQPRAAVLHTQPRAAVLHRGLPSFSFILHDKALRGHYIPRLGDGGYRQPSLTLSGDMDRLPCWGGLCRPEWSVWKKTGAIGGISPSAVWWMGGAGGERVITSREVCRRPSCALLFARYGSTWKNFCHKFGTCWASFRRHWPRGRAWMTGLFGSSNARYRQEAAAEGGRHRGPGAEVPGHDRRRAARADGEVPQAAGGGRDARRPADRGLCRLPRGGPPRAWGCGTSTCS